MKKKSNKIWMVIVLLLAMVSVAPAATNYWRGNGNGGEWTPAEDTLWNNANNWISWPPPTWIPEALVPVAGQRVELNRTGYTTEINSDMDAACWSLHVGFWGDHTLDVTGGTLGVTGGLMQIGGGTGDNGVVNVSGGSISIADLFAVGGLNDQWGNNGGNGILNMSNGSISVGTNLQIGKYFGTGYVDLSGGVITAASLEMTANGLLNITGTGKVVLPGDQTVLANGYIGSGWILGQADYMTSGEYAGNTLITPEPATLALLGMGLVALLRRKG